MATFLEDRDLCWSLIFWLTVLYLNVRLAKFFSQSILPSKYFVSGGRWSEKYQCLLRKGDTSGTDCQQLWPRGNSTRLFLILVRAGEVAHFRFSSVRKLISPHVWLDHLCRGKIWSSYDNCSTLCKAVTVVCLARSLIGTVEHVYLVGIYYLYN